MSTLLRLHKFIFHKSSKHEKPKSRKGPHPKPLEQNGQVPADESQESRALRKASEPFRRKGSGARAEEPETENREFRAQLMRCLTNLNILDDITNKPDENTNHTLAGSQFLQEACEKLAEKWKLKDEGSEMAFAGLLLVLEHCLSTGLSNQTVFSRFLETLGFHTVFFWKRAVPSIYDSDMEYGTAYRDALLFSLALHDVNTGKNRLRELFAAVPGLRDSLIGRNAKRFQEAFHHMIQKRTTAFSLSESTAGSQADDMLDLDPLINDLGEEDPMSQQDKEPYEPLTSTPEPHEKSRSRSGSLTYSQSPAFHMGRPSFQSQLSSGSGSGSRPSFQTQLSNTGSGGGSRDPLTDGVVVGSGLVSQGHFTERVIAVSNAPPVSLKKDKKTENWELGQGSGGLVSCCAPVMSQDPENMWLACFGPEVPFGGDTEGERASTPLARPTNSLGLPWIRKTPAEIHMNMLQDPTTGDSAICDSGSCDEASIAPSETSMQSKEKKEQLSLMKVLKDYAKDNYTLDPVVVPQDDYNTYYSGISNGLLWPILHNLPEYVLKEYEDPNVLKKHWRAYVRVNYHFAINAVRQSRPQDFLWIHDYHLMQTGSIIQALDPQLEVGFFLHIPFQLPDNFFDTYGMIGDAMLRGVLRFGKVGFQTNRDRLRFIELVRKRLPAAKIKPNKKLDRVVITYEGFVCSIGVFPVSISNEEFLSVARQSKVIEDSRAARQKLIGDRPGRLFFSVERFDYTKGIREKLMAIKRYFEKYQDRRGKDVFFQVAVTNRRTVAAYEIYQDECIAMAEQINKDFAIAEDPDWKPLIFQTTGLNRPQLIAHYLAMNVGVVTPRKDGMNLVAKEMLVVNPKASLVLSMGAGTEAQFTEAGFYSDKQKLYHRVTDPASTEEFADVFHAAAIEEAAKVEEHGKILNDFLMVNDIEKWSDEFLDPVWSHQVIAATDVTTLEHFYGMMDQTRNVRCQVVEKIVKGLPLKPHFALSLRIAKECIESHVKVDGGQSKLYLKAAEFAQKEAVIDVTDELREFEKDLAFLDWVQGDEYDDVSRFLDHMAPYHPHGVEAYAQELDQTIALLTRGDHFCFFFTDRDGTLKSYAGSYRSSIQPAYSGVIQSQFAQRCAQYSAILTSAPLSNFGILDVSVMPDGSFCFGASGGREWYFSSSHKFKDPSIGKKELDALEEVAVQIENLLVKPDNNKFLWIGSGFQRHYGHLTVARQDCFGSVDEADSARWYHTICELVARMDPSGHLMHVSESDTDIKIFLKSQLSGRLFHKGHGIRVFLQHLNLDLTEGSILVCGDSETDLPMLMEALSSNPTNTYTVWVTQNEDLRAQVQKQCTTVGNNNYVFVSCPEVILGAMAHATVREIRIRPLPIHASTLQQAAIEIEDDLLPRATG